MFLRTTLAVGARTLGPDDVSTLVTASNLSMLFRLREYAEAEALTRDAREATTHFWSRSPPNTHHGRQLGKLSRSRSKHAEAAEIQREVLVQKTRLLGADYKETLTLENLAVSLHRCGQNVETDQLVRETLALARITSGPTLGLTQALQVHLGRAARW